MTLYSLVLFTDVSEEHANFTFIIEDLYVVCAYREIVNISVFWDIIPCSSLKVN
jgi:hypothetical protein